MTLIYHTRNGRDVEAQVLVGVDGKIIYDGAGLPLVGPLGITVTVGLRWITVTVH